MMYDNEAIVRNAYHTAEVGSAASPRMACLTTSSAKPHIEANI